MGLSAGSVSGKLGMDISDFKRGFIDAERTAKDSVSKINADVSKISAEAKVAVDELKQIFNQFKNEFKTLNSEIKSSVKGIQTNFTGLATSVKTSINNIKTETKGVISSVATLKQETASNLNAMKSEWSNAALNIQQSSDRMKRAAQQANIIKGGVGGVPIVGAGNSNVGGANGKGSKANGLVNNLGAVGVGSILYSQTVGLLKESYKLNADFEGTLVRAMFKSDMDPSTAKGKIDLKDLKEFAKKEGARSAYTNTQVAGGIDTLAAVDYTIPEIKKSIPGLIDAALATNTDLTAMADITTGTVNAFGLKKDQLGKVGDQYSVAANKTGANVMDLGETMKYAALPGDTFGADVSSALALAGMMSNVDLKGSMAGTSMRRGFEQLAAPKKNQANALKELGITTSENGKIRDTGKIVSELSAKFDKLNQVQKVHYAEVIFGTDAMNGWLAIFKQGPKKFDELKKAIDDSLGSSTKLANIFSKTDAGKLMEYDGAVENFKMALADALPILTDIVVAITDLLKGFNNLDPTTKQVIGWGVLLVAGLGAILTVIGALGIAIPAITAGFSILGVVLGFIFAPITLIIIAIIAIVAAIWYLSTHWEDFKRGWKLAWDEIVNATKGSVDWISGVFDKFWKWLTKIWNDSKDFIVNTWNDLMTYFGNNLEKNLSAIEKFFTDLWDNIKNGFNGFLDDAYNFGKNIVTKLVDGIKSLGKLPKQAWDGLLNFGGDLIHGAEDLLYGKSSANGYGSNSVNQTMTTSKSTVIQAPITVHASDPDHIVKVLDNHFEELQKRHSN